MEEYKLIGSRIRSLRESRGEVQQDLARLLGVTPEAVGHYERGRTKISIVDLRRIASHYGVPISYFLGDEEEQPTTEERVQSRLWKLAREAEKLRREVEQLTGDVARLVGIPIRGTVPGGYPDFGEEVNLKEHFPVPTGLIRDPEKAFALRVTGDSMNGRGILDGDVVMIEPILEPEAGDIVVVRSDDGVMLRICKRDQKGPYLEGANEGYEPLRPKEGQIVGVVVYAGREYRRRNGTR